MKTANSKTGTMLPITGHRFLPFLLLLLCIQAGAQTSRPRTAADSAAIEEKLVELALQGPAYKTGEHQNKVYEYQLKSAKNSWLNLLSISTNYNDQSFAKSSTPGTAYVYPKYFFGLTIPLGTIFSRTEVRAAQEGVAIGELSQEQLRRSIRAEVLSKYKQYRAYQELIALQAEMLNDMEVELMQTEEKFKKGTVTIDIYNAAQRNINGEKTRMINLELQRDLLELDIEKIIGTDLQSVIR
ncbi:MAG TPA: TolC family protein [Flavisolibacter sp.]